jgi:hypothetical protein
VGRSIGRQINPALLFDYPTLESLAGYVVRDLLHLGPEESPPPPAEAKEVADEIQQQAMADVEEMSEAEMDDLVTEQLVKLQQ